MCHTATSTSMSCQRKMRVDGKAILLVLLSIIATKDLATRAAAEEISVCHSTSEVECFAPPTSSRDDCFAWFPSRAKDLLTPLFPNVTLLACAWEEHPLLSKVSLSNRNQSGGIHRIPTAFHNGTFVASHQSGENSDTDKLSWISLVSVEDIPSILSQTINGHPLIHGSDYKLVKKIVMPPSHEYAGEEYMGMLPKPQYSIQEILHHFHYGGFSLVVDSMQKRTEDVAKKAEELKDAFAVKNVGVNLYLTPEALEDYRDQSGGFTEKQVRQGFEAHWDWMDVFVIQISGQKRWSVAKQPTIYLSNKDQKRKPTKEEAEYFASKEGHFLDITLCPGDALYIPRGFVHNASTIDFEQLKSYSGYDDAWDGCPDYTADSALGQSLASRLNGPSLHLTFGIEHGCKGTMEALLHHALHAYFANAPSSNFMDKISTCGATWKSILHYSLGEVARRQHKCDNPAYNGVVARDGCGGNAILRRSALSFPNVGNGLSSDKMQQTSNLKQMYQKSIDAFLLSADMTRALEFVKSHVMQPSDPKLSFCFPGYSSKDAITCVDELLSSTDATSGRFLQIVKGFVVYASANFDAALIHMNKHVVSHFDKKQ
ncbi:hypothetical protein ACHAWX_002764 [Stephanocyclus meneghinianus]